ncbi:hypothetical protein ACFHYR_10735 [Pasteurella multocida]
MPFDLPPALPPSQQEIVVCAISASAQYKIPVTALLAVADTEGGKPGQWVKNSNGTYDVGAMQFNTSYLKELEKHGIATKDVEKSGCYPYYLAAWRISNHIQNDQGDFWRKVANYHSKTPEKNAIYQAKLIPAAAKWDKWFKANMEQKNETVLIDNTKPPLPKQIDSISHPSKFDIDEYKGKITFAPIPQGTIADSFNIKKSQNDSPHYTPEVNVDISTNAMKSSSSIELSAEFIKLAQTP